MSLRVTQDEAGDREVSGLKAQRLQREISKLKPGENVTLSVYSNGRVHDVTMKVARAGDLPKNARGGYTIVGGDGFGWAPMAMPAMPSMPSMPRIAPMPPAASYRYDVEPRMREQMENMRVQLRNIEPTIRMNLENVRPQIERAVQRVRIRSVTV